MTNNRLENTLYIVCLTSTTFHIWGYHRTIDPPFFELLIKLVSTFLIGSDPSESIFFKYSCEKNKEIKT